VKAKKSAASLSARGVTIQCRRAKPFLFPRPEMTYTMLRLLAPLGIVLVLGQPADAQRVIRSSAPSGTTNGLDCVLPDYPYLLPAPAEALPWCAPHLAGLNPPWAPGSAAPSAYQAYSAIARPTRAPAAGPVRGPGPVRPSDRRARLALDVPANARVWLAGQPVDMTVRPVVLESGVLGPGQTFTFDVKVTWPEGDKTEERTRTVTVDAGNRVSVTYFGGR
jgi:uncharacterized protein (TIGR03000 family)